MDPVAVLREFPSDPSRWADAVCAHAEAPRLLAAVRDAWIDDRLTPAVWESLTGTRVARAAVDRAMGAIFAEIDRRGVRAPHVERRIDRDESDGEGETAVRRWCWTPSWRLMSQDEDLLLMTDDFLPWLLDEAAARCTKRDYVLRIVEHHARDSAHHALWDGADPKPRFVRIGEWLPAVERARAPELVDYFTRLAGYAHAARVSRYDARQRVFDLRRCTARTEIEPELERRGDEWVARFDLADVTPGELHVHAESGEMWAERRTP